MRSTDTSNVHLLDKVTFQDAPGTVKVLQPNRQASFLVVSVTEGGVDIYFQGNSGGLPLTPDLHFGQTNKPEVVPIPCGQMEFACVAIGPGLGGGGGTAGLVLATVWAGGP